MSVFSFLKSSPKKSCNARFLLGSGKFIFCFPLFVPKDSLTFGATVEPTFLTFFNCLQKFVLFQLIFKFEEPGFRNWYFLAHKISLICLLELISALFSQLQEGFFLAGGQFSGSICELFCEKLPIDVSFFLFDPKRLKLVT